MARIVISDGTSQREVDLSDAVTLAGRSSENKIHVEDKQASRKHFQIERIEHGFKLVDLESRNGTRVNDRVVNQALLRPGDRITIGKHTLTFVDPNFKEPPAEVAARFAPPAAAPVVAVPVAERVPVPAPSPSPQPAAAEPEPRIRRRSGHTTSLAIERVHRSDRAKEQKMLTWVGVGAGTFIFILIVLIIIPSGESPVGKQSSNDYATAHIHYQNRRYSEARALLARIGPDQRDWYPKAQSLLRSIDDAEKKMAAAVSEAEKRDFDALYEFCDKNRANPTAYDRMFGMCSDFKQKYPQSKSMAPVDEFVKVASEGRKGNRMKELGDGIAAAQEELKKNEFALAIRRVNALTSKFTDDVETHERLVKLHDEIADKGKEHFQGKHAEAKDLVARGKKDEAAKLYDSLSASLGDVDEFSIQAQIVKTSLQGLR